MIFNQALHTFLANAACHLGETECPPGSSGPGGCHQMLSRCQDGLICDPMQDFCLRGSTGPGVNVIKHSAIVAFTTLRDCYNETIINNV